MPKGFEGIREAIESKQGSGGGGPRGRYFKVAPGETEIVRFLEGGEDITWGWFHRTAPREGRKFGDYEPCNNQERDGTPCAFCSAGVKREIRAFINLIWRGAPVREKINEVWQETGEKEDIVVTWASGEKLFEQLDGVDAAFRGLTSRDFAVTRMGESYPTYRILPVDVDAGPQPMSAADKALAEVKPDLDEFLKPVAQQQLATSGATTNPNPFRGR